MKVERGQFLSHIHGGTLPVLIRPVVGHGQRARFCIEIKGVARSQSRVALAQVVWETKECGA